jgi:hypothetical protein
MNQIIHTNKSIIILNEAFNITPHHTIAELYKTYPYANIHKNRIPAKNKSHLQNFLNCAPIGTIIRCEESYSFKIDTFLPSPVIYHIIAFNCKQEMENNKFPDKKLIDTIIQNLNS